MKKSDIDNLLAEEVIEDIPEVNIEEYPEGYQEYILEEE